MTHSKFINQTKRKIDFKKWSKFTIEFPIKEVTVVNVKEKNTFNILKAYFSCTLFRGCVTENNEIIIVASKWETKNSLYWIYLHEAAHIIVERNLDLYKNCIQRNKKHKKYINSERFCNQFATMFCGKDYGDKWFSPKLTKEYKKWQKKNQVSKSRKSK